MKENIVMASSIIVNVDGRSVEELFRILSDQAEHSKGAMFLSRNAYKYLINAYPFPIKATSNLSTDIVLYWNVPYVYLSLVESSSPFDILVVKHFIYNGLEVVPHLPSVPSELSEDRPILLVSSQLDLQSI